MAGRCSCRHHKTHGGGGRESGSQVATTRRSLCSASGSPAAGAGPAVSLALNPAPTRAASAAGAGQSWSGCF